jgi:hypothetical protein
MCSTALADDMVSGRVVPINPYAVGIDAFANGLQQQDQIQQQQYYQQQLINSINRLSPEYQAQHYLSPEQYQQYRNQYQYDNRHH